MDGVADETDVVKTAMNYGMKAVAITDHNGVQGFQDDTLGDKNYCLALLVYLYSSNS